MSGMTTKATKTARTLVGEASNAAGSSTVGDAVDLTTAMGLVVTGRVSNGATGPSEGCDFVVEVSPDGVAWHEWSRQRAGTEAGRTYVFGVELNAAVMHARVLFEGNTGEAVMVEASGQELTSLGTSG